MRVEPAIRSLPTELTDLLRPDRAAGWVPAWRLARGWGTAVEGALRAAWAAESHARARLVLMVAVAVAARPDARIAFLLERVDGDDDRARLLALLMLAFDAGRSGGVPAVSRVANGRGANERAARVAALLALHRFPDAAAPPRRAYESDDPGLAAAARYARPRDPDPELYAWFRGRRAHEELVRRAWLLGQSDRRASPASLEKREWRWWAEALSGEGSEASVGAAGVFLGRAAEFESVLGQLTRPLAPEVAVVAAADPATRDRLVLRGSLDQPLPPRIGRSAVLRGAVAWGLSVDPRLAADAAASWRQDEDVGAAVCLALALRAFAADDSVERAAIVPAELLEVLPPVSAASWVRVAGGAEDLPARPGGDEFDVAFGLARRGALVGDAAARAIERELWRRGWHPGMAVRQAESDLIRDVLLGGSRDGRRPTSSQDAAYVVAGWPRDEAFFRLAFELFRFLVEPGPQPPDRYRLVR